MQPRWVVIGLVVSVALNLFLIGAGAGVIALGVRMARENSAPRPGVFVRATRDLPPADRRAMRLMLRQAWSQTEDAARQSWRLRTDAWSSLSDPKADPAVAKAKLAQARQLDVTSRAGVEDRIVGYVLGLSPSDRAIFAAGMRRALPPPTPITAPPPTNQAAPN